MENSKRKELIASHALTIYTRMPGKLPVTNRNRPGNKALVEQAIQLAELFQEVLEEHGYCASGEDSDDDV